MKNLKNKLANKEINEILEASKQAKKGPVYNGNLDRLVKKILKK